MAVDSSQLTPPTGTGSARRSRSAPSDADGVVVTHGTDTMEETALWLDLTYDGAAPVVITGAQRSADAPDADGPGNLRDALTCGGQPAGQGPRCAGRFRGDGLAAARAAEGGDGRPRRLRRNRGRFGRRRPVQPGQAKERPFLGALSARRRARVDIVAVYPGGDAVAIDACVAAGARGIVLEALGSGNAGEAVIDGGAAALSRRSGGGGVDPGARREGRRGYGPGRELVDAGAVMVPRLRPPQARVLLMAALASGSPVDDVVARWG